MSAKELEKLIERASRGSRSSADLFFRTLLTTTFFVPERRGAEFLSINTTYPDSLFTLLGVTVEDRTYIPFFLDEEYVAQWCGRPLTCRTMTGRHLFSLTPKAWWLCINPGQYVEKEFSPWEIDLLRLGSAAIPEIVNELYTNFEHEEFYPEIVTAEAVHESDFQRLRESAAVVAEGHPEIEKMFILKETHKLPDGTSHERPLIGVALEQTAETDPEIILESLRSAARISQIGAAEPRVYIGYEGDPNNIALKLFQDSEPFYRKPIRTSVFTKGMMFFSRNFR
jgi:SseB protein N-terminal domain